jgi:hypothetical protein
MSSNYLTPGKKKKQYLGPKENKMVPKSASALVSSQCFGGIINLTLVFERL